MTGVADVFPPIAPAFVVVAAGVASGGGSTIAIPGAMGGPSDDAVLSQPAAAGRGA